MARTSVTFEQVAAIANALYAAGNKDPGTEAIRDELAKRAGPGMPIGSPNTVQRHLGAWRDKSRPVDPQGPPPQLPPQLAADIARALSAAAVVAREESATPKGTHVTSMQASPSLLESSGTIHSALGQRTTRLPRNASLSAVTMPGRCNNARSLPSTVTSSGPRSPVCPRAHWSQLRWNILAHSWLRR